MKIAIDCTAPVFGGGVTWMRELVPRLCELSPDDRFYILIKPEFRWIESLLPENGVCILLRLPRRFQAVWRLGWQQFVLPIWLKTKAIDLFVAPYDTAPLLDRRKMILGIQNASPYWGPSASTLGGRARAWLIRWLSRKSAQKAERVFFVSRWAQEQIGDRLGLSDDKRAVVCNGVSEAFVPANSAHGSDPYILAVGSIYVYKDYETLIDALGVLISQGLETLRLVIAGGIFDLPYYQRLLSRLDASGIADSVEFVTTHLQEEIVELYQFAALVVLPSQVETFGLPLVEAMACGVPVVASDIPVAREVCVDAALYYTLGDVDSLVEQIREIIENDSLVAKLVELGLVRAREFSWVHAAQQAQQILNGSYETNHAVL